MAQNVLYHFIDQDCIIGGHPNTRSNLISGSGRAEIFTEQSYIFYSHLCSLSNLGLLYLNNVAGDITETVRLDRRECFNVLQVMWCPCWLPGADLQTPKLQGPDCLWFLSKQTLGSDPHSSCFRYRDGGAEGAIRQGLPSLAKGGHCCSSHSYRGSDMEDTLKDATA